MKPGELPARLAEIEAQGLYRRRRILERPKGEQHLLDGRKVVNFSSNDYLGLADHPDLVEGIRRGAELYGAGSGASHLVTGHGPAHHALEDELADFTGRDRALLFSSGYMANLGVITALAGRGDWVFEDRLNHVSLLDGALVSGARLKRYPHGDAGALAFALADCPVEGKMVVTDGVFSMDGDIAPLPGLAKAAQGAEAWLMVDDAHGLGVIGPNGGGSLEHFGLGVEEVPVLMGTLGKAFGTFGAFVAGSSDLVEYLIQRARTYIYTTAMPPAVAEATRASLKLVKTESWRREKLASLIKQFREGASQLGLELMESNTPIQPILIGDNLKVSRVSQELLEAGFLAAAIRPPTVPAGTARLRITLSAAHQEEQVERLLEALAKAVSSNA